MSLVEELMDTARADTDLLFKFDERGDDFSIPRIVDFHFFCPDKDKAKLVADFLEDVRYGTTSVFPSDNRYALLLQLEMPLTQNVICAVSGAMACAAQLFGIEYTGWGCVPPSAT